MAEFCSARSNTISPPQWTSFAPPFTVATSHVDVAAIDAVSWALAERHEPATSALRILDCTAPTPGLPLITACSHKTRLKPIRLAVIEALASLDEGVRDDLLLMGFAQTTEQDYEVIKSRFEAITQPKKQIR